MKRLMALLLCFCLMLGIFAGCGGEKEPYTPTGDGLNYDEDYTGPVYTRPQNDDQQTLSLTYYPKVTMNPILCGDFTNRALFSLLYQGLFSVDRKYQIEPVLCKNYRVSEDMKTYVFYIEQATFSDGQVLTVNDVLATLRSAQKSDYYGGRFTHITEMDITSDGGIQIKTDTPYENLPLLLDIPIVKKNQQKAKKPLGTGPYVLDTSAETAVLRKNTQWWCKSQTVITAPAISLVEAKSETQIRDEFEFNGLSLVCADPGSDRYADYRCDYELWDIENNILLYLATNMDSPVFSVPEIRGALPRAIDRETIADDFYRGFARAASLPASPLSPYYSNVLADKYAYSGAEELKKAVKAADLPAETVVTLLVNKDDSLRTRVARSVAKMLEKGGLSVTLREETGEKYRNCLKNREYDIYLGQTKLSSNMDLSAFFSGSGSLSFGGINDVALYTLCMDSLANQGNYYTLHQNVLNDGRLCPILFRSYAVYAVRGVLTDLKPARDNVFYYSLGKTMERAKLETLKDKENT